MEAPRLAEYDASWPSRFAEEAALLGGALSGALVGVEHVGSTSVPGLAAKPTIDIAAGVAALPLGAAAVAALEALGYEDAALGCRPGEHVFRKGRRVPRDVTLHVVEWGGAAWNDHVNFRDALRADGALATEYAALRAASVATRGDWCSGEDERVFVERALAAATRLAVASESPEETETWGARLAEALAAGDVVTIAGELGSGKTTLVRGVCRALGVAGPVTSPTYTIGHRYVGRVTVSHLDLYRYADVSPAEWGDLEPYFDDALALVEWPEAAGDLLRDARCRVRVEHAGRLRRHLHVRGDAALIGALRRALA